MTEYNNSRAHSNGQQPPRVVITGVGAITPLGLNVEDTWQGLIAGRSGIDHIKRFDTTDLQTTFAGEVKGFDPANYIDRKEVRRIDPYLQFAVAAAQQAVADAKLDFSQEEPTRIGVIAGSGVGGIQSAEEGQALLQTKGLRRVSPFLIPNLLPDSITGRIAIEFNLRGLNHAVISACATGTSACGEAFEVLRRGDADVMLAGGAEAALTPMLMAGFAIMGALSQHNEDPAGACRPFAQDRTGFVMSEGAAILVLETEEHAKARGAKIYAEVIGFGSSNDAFHMAAPHEEGRGAADAMRMALRKAAAYGVQPDQIDYINAHGTATHINDIVETQAIKDVLREHAYQLRISSTKSMLGHLLGGAGAIEAIICAKVINEGIIPPTINLHHPDPQCDLNYTPLHAQQAKVDVTLSNSFGFGGHNACIMLRRYESRN
jgi:3-oxoacyl-[acyl-carrier-protein] synthase II